MSTTTTYRFHPYKHRAQAKGKCPVCGKAVTRSMTFEETCNPFNKNPDGTVKTPAEIMVSLNTKAKAWKPDFTHERCRS
jgi:hypothetical protein